jgi:apolipoprotein N-acyltransferase
LRPALSPLVDALLAALLGGLHSVPAAFPQAWPLQLACVALLAWRVADATPGRAALLGASFGSAWLAAGTWWLFISMHRYGGLPAWMAALAVAGLSLVLALYLSLALALCARWRQAHVALDALLLAGLWLVAELARGVLFTGFPWLASGYAHVESPLAALAPWIGVYGIGCVAAFASALVGLAVAETRGRRAALAALVLVAAGTAGAINDGGFTQSAGRVDVTLLQTNVAQDQKFAADRLPQAMDDLAAALAAARGSLVVAPETAVPLLPDQLAAPVAQR